MSILPRHVTTVFVAWRMGALTAGHLFCPEGHRLSCHLISECIGATARFQGLDFPLTTEDPNINQSVIDFVFRDSPRQRWTLNDREVLLLIPVLRDVQLKCNQAVENIIR